MMATIILDTDFLSSFLKIGQCDLIRSLYQVEQVFIPTAVHRELAQTDLLTLLLTIDWIKVPSSGPSADETLLQDATFQGVTVVNIPAFLLACKIVGLVGLEQMEQIIQDLKAKDFYEFKSEIRDELLK